MKFETYSPPIASGYIDERGVVQLIPAKFWSTITPLDTRALMAQEHMPAYLKKRLFRLLKLPPPPGKVRIVLCKEDLERKLREHLQE